MVSFFVTWMPSPPRRWCSHSSVAPMELTSVKRRLAAIHSPSGLQAPQLVSFSPVSVSTAGSPPSAGISHRLVPPPRSLVKRISVPSGL